MYTDRDLQEAAHHLLETRMADAARRQQEEKRTPAARAVTGRGKDAPRRGETAQYLRQRTANAAKYLIRSYSPPVKDVFGAVRAFFLFLYSHTLLPIVEAKRQRSAGKEPPAVSSPKMAPPMRPRQRFRPLRLVLLTSCLVILLGSAIPMFPSSSSTNRVSFYTLVSGNTLQMVVRNPNPIDYGTDTALGALRDYTLTWVPNGYRQTETGDSNSVCFQREDGAVIRLSWTYDGSAAEKVVFQEEDELELIQTQLEGNDALLCINHSAADNPAQLYVAWEEPGCLFTISGSVTKEEILHMGESIAPVA